MLREGICVYFQEILSLKARVQRQNSWSNGALATFPTSIFVDFHKSIFAEFPESIFAEFLYCKRGWTSVNLHAFHICMLFHICQASTSTLFAFPSGRYLFHWNTKVMHMGPVTILRFVNLKRKEEKD